MTIAEELIAAREKVSELAAKVSDFDKSILREKELAQVAITEAQALKTKAEKEISSATQIQQDTEKLKSEVEAEKALNSKFYAEFKSQKENFDAEVAKKAQEILAASGGAAVVIPQEVTETPAELYARAQAETDPVKRAELVAKWRAAK